MLHDLEVSGEHCRGQRFDAETLAVVWRGRSNGDALNRQVDEAGEFFVSMPPIAHPLRSLKDVGLGYVALGQPSLTLSGG